MFRNHETIWAGIKWNLKQLLPLVYRASGYCKDSEEEEWHPFSCTWVQWFVRVLWAEWLIDEDNGKAVHAVRSFSGRHNMEQEVDARRDMAAGA